MTTNQSEVYVCPLSPNVTTDHLREIMGNFGEIYSVDLESISGCPDRQIGKVQFNDSESARSALTHMDRGEIDGLRIRVTFEKPEGDDLQRLIK
ncbi:RNA recognition motif domain containing protein [Babesia bovis T2Bo]|uniref:RRM domain-containing protein n=1 Tax=Babesia bovis TaxID=5865 RepID=A7APA1_BABBO|nr:RNA recognition motif domain containing protein [Babesia bovis T2Bo]EDO08385.1 RNA recognition motif domain containing protein [Babesia bovis T2Bo]|eukprot:XP_001611953.1 hypothetical protein [Babesia bovis T2Bo]